MVIGMGRQHTGKKKRNQKRKLDKVLCAVFLTVGCLVILWGILLESGLGKKTKEQVTFTVNGEAVTEREVSQRIAYMHRAVTIDHFSREKGMELDEGFWDRECNGITPRQYLKEQAIEDCARIKLAELAMKEYGLLEDVSYQAFLDSLERENQRREESNRKGQVIYGPQKYGEGEYFAYAFANLETELKKRLDEALGWSAEENLKRYYEEHKDTYYRYSDSIEVEKITLPYEKASREELEKELEQVRKEVEGGKSFVEAAQKLGTVETQRFDEESAREDSRHYEPLKLAVMELKKQEISPVIDDGSSLSVLFCTAKEEGGYRPYEEAADNVVSLVREESYEKWLDTAYREADLQIKNENVFKEVK